MRAQVGRLYALHCGGDFSDWAVFDPFDSRVGQRVYNPYFAYVYMHAEGAVLFDTGIHPDAGQRLAATDTFELEVDDGDRIDRKLATIGLSADDVAVVVQSHLHFDHAGGLAWMANVPVMVQRRELEFATDPPVYQRAVYVPDDFAADIEWRLLDRDEDVFGDGSVTVLQTPGHTPGHQSLLVMLEKRPVLLLADAAYQVEKMRERCLPALLWSPDAIVASWERIESIEQDTGAELIATHDVLFRQRVRMAPDEWYE